MKSLLDSVTELEDVIRQLHKMVSKMRSGQFIDAYRDANSVIARLENNRKAIISEQLVEKNEK